MSTSDSIRDFITGEILHGTLKDPLHDQDSLIESGIIDSMGVMTLLAFLEDKFSIQIPGDELLPENFESISTITTLVDRHLVR
ncbi:MAG: acyl carrier protein [Anaerolineales bacterium]|nr:acyl carrier protein [Anaerolineales bacterium]